MDLNTVLTEYNASLDAFAKGDSGPIKPLMSRADDVVLANPFGPAVRGWTDVEARIDYAAARFRDGKMDTPTVVSSLVSGDLAFLHTVEDWSAKISGREDLDTFRLRVTTVFRLEDAAWRIVLRHADPISTEDEDGPIRGRRG